MAELGHYYPWASPTYLLDYMSMDQWYIYRCLIPEDRRLIQANPREPGYFLDEKPVDGIRTKRK